MKEVLSNGRKGVVLNTFLFLILTFILIFAVFVIIAPFISAFFSIWGKVQTGIETGMYGNVTNSTQEMINTGEQVKTLLPYLLVISFVLSVLIYGAWTEIIKGGG